MVSRSPASHRTPGASVLGPLNPPAYLTWLAVALSPLLDWSTPVALNTETALGLVSQISFMLLFVLRAYWEGRSIGPSRLRPLVAAQALAALGATWGLHDKMQGVMLVLVAAQLPAIASLRWSIGILTLGNIGLSVLFAQLFPPVKAVQMEIAYLAFQLFAALVTDYAYRAFEARETTQRINTELMATRRLLEESARTEERLRLSRELHDVMGHKLTALKLQLALQVRESASARTPVQSPAPAARKSTESPDSSDVPAARPAAAEDLAAPADAAIRHCVRITDELLIDVRGVVTRLRESDGIDLHQALRALDPGLPSPRVVFELDPTVRVPDIRQAEAMLRCAQEGLTNALRHSRADEVRVILTDSAEGLTLTVDDDGVGSQAEPGNGLMGLQERLKQLGGQLRVAARVPRGLSLTAVLPHAPASL
jgi:signal transduction histidine kinase